MFTIGKLYVWQGITRTGKFCKGKAPEQDIQLLRSRLKRQGIVIKTIQPRSRLIIAKSIKTQELLIFTRQISRLLQAGLPLVQILELLENSSSNLVLKKFNQQLRLDLEDGYSLTEALQLNQPYFSQFYVHLMALGEKTSSLDLALTNISDDMEKNLKLKSKLTSALFYPSLVIVVAIFVFLGLLIGIVPQFEQLFAEVGAKLPLLTQLVIGLSDFFKSSLIIIGLFLFTISVSFFLLKKRYPIISVKQDQLLVKLPIIKKILEEVIIIRMSRCLAIALYSGLPLLDAMQIISDMTKNYVYKKAIQLSCESIRNGESIYNAFKLQTILPEELLQFIKLGEVSASLVEMLNNVADLNEQRLDYFVSNLSKLMEPLMIITLGVIIGGLIIAMYLPIFKLGSVI